MPWGPWAALRAQRSPSTRPEKLPARRSSPAATIMHSCGAVGAFLDLGTLGGTQSFAYAINNNGDVVGYSYTASGDTHAFSYSGGVLMDLNSLLPASSGWNVSTMPASLPGADFFVALATRSNWRLCRKGPPPRP
jgi:probable HAF family extracellular repeat protein